MAKSGYATSGREDFQVGLAEIEGMQKDRPGEKAPLLNEGIEDDEEKRETEYSFFIDKTAPPSLSPGAGKRKGHLEAPANESALFFLSHPKQGEDHLNPVGKRKTK